MASTETDIAMPSSGSSNPYVGPRTFRREQGHLFFGREREARDLLARVVSERLLLFYAQSGAGKSSLINARLIPGLQQEGFAVLPVGRVGGELPVGLGGAGNVFLLNLMRSLDQGEGDAARFAGLSLSDFLTHLATEDGEKWEYQAAPAIAPSQPEDTPPQRFVLVIDQFEEIIATHPDRWEERAEFFRQLDRAMRDDSNLWVVLALREDYVAALDPYASLLADRLRARFYMERMGGDAALEAVREPAKLAGCPFAPGVAEQLVDDLRRVRAAATGEPILGQYVEPVQLQVVCRELWESVPADRPSGDRGCTITAEQMRQSGDVNEALERFYEATLPGVMAGTGLGERVLRTWVSGALITPAQTRGLVYRGAADTAGLPHPGIDLFDAGFLVRPVLRGSDTWYELSHDRLVEPIQEANRRWQAAYANPVTDVAQKWVASGKATAALLDGRQLVEARAFAAAHPGELTEDEATYLAASESAYREARRRRTVAITSTVGIAVFALFLGLALFSRARAQEAALQAQQAARQAEYAAHQQQSLAESRQLAAAAMDNLNADPELSALLAIEALTSEHTREAEQALHTAIQGRRLLHAIDAGQGQLWKVAVSPDGTTIATGGEDGTIRLWDATTGAPLRTLNGHTGRVQGVAFSPDGSRLASASGDGTARTWDPASGSEMLRIDTPGGPLYDVAFNGDGTLLATGGKDGMARVWDAATGDSKRAFGPTVGSVWNVAFDPEGGALATASGFKNPGQSPGLAQVWDMSTGDELLAFGGHASTVEAIAFSPISGPEPGPEASPGLSAESSPESTPDRTRIVTGGWDNVVRVWDKQTGEPLLALPGHTSWIRSIAFSPDGSRVASTSFDRRAKVWDLASGRELFTLAGHTGDVRGVAFTPDGNHIVTTSSDGALRIWNAGPTSELWTASAHEGQRVNSVAFFPDGSALATAGADGTARVWDGTTGVMRFQVKPPIPEEVEDVPAVNDVAISADGRILATAGDDRTARLWDAATGASLPFVAEHPVSVLSLALSTDGKLLATGASDGLVRLWDVGSGALVRTLEGHSNFVNDVAFSRPDGKLLASASGDSTVRIWDVASGSELHQLKGHTDQVYHLAFSPDNTRLATASVDQTARVWDVESGEEQFALGAHGDRVQSVTFSPDGTQLATTSWDGKTRLWDAASGALQLALTGHENKVRDVAYSPDGRTLATVGDDGTLRLYLTHIEELIPLALERLQRGWTGDECQTYLRGKPCPAALN